MYFENNPYLKFEERKKGIFSWLFFLYISGTKVDGAIWIVYAGGIYIYKFSLTRDEIDCDLKT